MNLAVFLKIFKPQFVLRIAVISTSWYLTDEIFFFFDLLGVCWVLVAAHEFFDLCLGCRIFTGSSELQLQHARSSSLTRDQTQAP